MTSSDSSCASLSTISTPSVVPATTRSSVPKSFTWSAVGLSTYSPIDIADAAAGDGAEERNAGQGQRGRAADQGDHIGVVLEVMAQHGGDHLHLVAEPLREQRADRPVDQAADQRLLLGGAALTLEEAAGILPAAKVFSW